MKDSIILIDNPERWKYEKIYAGAVEGYGGSFHGRDYVEKACKFSSVLDVGCGHNNFCSELRRVNPKIKAVGVDFVDSHCDMKADILDLPFGNDDFDLVTAFDVLEHLREEQIYRALFELMRVSKNFAFSISYRPSVILVDGQNLHPLVKDELWWLELLGSFSTVEKYGIFVHGVWNKKD